MAPRAAKPVLEPQNHREAEGIQAVPQLAEGSSNGHQAVLEPLARPVSVPTATRREPSGSPVATRAPLAGSSTAVAPSGVGSILSANSFSVTSAPAIHCQQHPTAAPVLAGSGPGSTPPTPGSSHRMLLPSQPVVFSVATAVRQAAGGGIGYPAGVPATTMPLVQATSTAMRGMSPPVLSQRPQQTRELYRATHPEGVNVRTGIEIDTPIIRNIPRGQVFEAFETAMNKQGILRLRLHDGWTSKCSALDGTPIVERVTASIPQFGLPLSCQALVPVSGRHVSRPASILTPAVPSGPAFGPATCAVTPLCSSPLRAGPEELKPATVSACICVMRVGGLHGSQPRRLFVELIYGNNFAQTSVVDTMPGELAIWNEDIGPFPVLPHWEMIFRLRDADRPDVSLIGETLPLVLESLADDTTGKWIDSRDVWKDGDSHPVCQLQFMCELLSNKAAQPAPNRTASPAPASTQPMSLVSPQKRPPMPAVQGPRPQPCPTSPKPLSASGAAMRTVQQQTPPLRMRLPASPASRRGPASPQIGGALVQPARLPGRGTSPEPGPRPRVAGPLPPPTAAPCQFRPEGLSSPPPPSAPRSRSPAGLYPSGSALEPDGNSFIDNLLIDVGLM